MLLSRRSFLVKGSLAAASVAVASRTLPALTPGDLSLTPEHSMPEPFNEDGLRALASSAIDAAKVAGAQYADVRIVERQDFRTIMYLQADLPRLDIGV